VSDETTFRLRLEKAVRDIERACADHGFPASPPDIVVAIDGGKGWRRTASNVAPDLMPEALRRMAAQLQFVHGSSREGGDRE
jgi:hypothetical protein